MKIVNLLFWLLAFGLFSVSYAQSSDTASLLFFPAQFDLGDLHEIDTVTKDIRVENHANHPIVLADVLTTCGCTALSVPESPIGPGESTQLTISFDAHDAIGYQRKVVQVIDDQGKHYKIIFTANVLP